MPFDQSKGSVFLAFNAAAKPSLEEVKSKFKLADNEVEDDITPLGNQQYLILVSAEAGERIEKDRMPGVKVNPFKWPF